MKRNDKLTFYENFFLIIFADAYPDSAQFRGGQQFRKGGWSRVFPEIEKSVDNKNNFLSAVESLVNRGVILVKWKRYRQGDVVTALYLESPDLVYSLLGKANPENIRLEELDLLYSFESLNFISGEVVKFLINQLEQKEKLLIKNKEHLEEFFLILSMDPEFVTQYTIRALSVRLFNDSKRLEKIISGFDRITETASGIKISKHLGLERVYPETTIGGNLNLIFSNGRKWSLYGEIITIPEQTAGEIKKIEFDTDSPKVLSIENKETFYTLSSTLSVFHGFVYCSGHLNSSDRLIYGLLEKSNVDIYHFGDLDPEGLIIFDEIDCIVGGRLKPYLMNEKIYQKYLDCAYELSPGAMKRIDLVKNKKIFNLVRLIKNSGKGVEQEIIEVDIKLEETTCLLDNNSL
jgi:Wadjet anti plasmid transformation system JetA-like protein